MICLSITIICNINITEYNTYTYLFLLVCKKQLKIIGGSVYYRKT